MSAYSLDKTGTQASAIIAGSAEVRKYLEILGDRNKIDTLTETDPNWPGSFMPVLGFQQKCLFLTKQTPAEEPRELRKVGSRSLRSIEYLIMVSTIYIYIIDGPILTRRVSYTKKAPLLVPRKMTMMTIAAPNLLLTLRSFSFWGLWEALFWRQKANLRIYILFFSKLFSCTHYIPAGPQYC